MFSVCNFRLPLYHCSSCGLHDAQDAFGMLNEMGQTGVMPTVDTFNTLMDACVRRNDPPAVLRLFRQMVQSGACTALTYSYFFVIPPPSPRGGGRALPEGLRS